MFAILSHFCASIYGVDQCDFKAARALLSVYHDSCFSLVFRLKVALTTNRPLLCQFCVTGTLTALGQTTGIVPGEHAWCNSLIPLSGTHACDTRSVTPGKLTIAHARTSHTHIHTRTRTCCARARWQTRTRKAKEPCLATIRVNFTRAISASPPQK